MIIAVISLFRFFIVQIIVYHLLKSSYFSDVAMMLAALFPFIGIIIMIYGRVTYPKNPILIGVMIAEVVMPLCIILFLALLFLLIYGSYWFFFGFPE